MRTTVPWVSSSAQAEPAQKMTDAASGRPMVAVTRPVAGSTRSIPPWLGITHSDPAPTALTSGMFTRVRVAPAAGLMRVTDPLASPLVTQGAPKPAMIPPAPVPARMGKRLTRFVSASIRSTMPAPGLGSLTHTRP